MTIDAASQQLPPADELAAIRADLKRLEERQSALRSILLSDPSSRTGNRFAVKVTTVTQNQVDIRELRALYPDIVDSQTFPREIKQLVLLEISEDGEVTRIKRTGK